MKQHYQERYDRFKKQSDAFSGKSNVLTYLRLLIFIGGLVFVSYLFNTRGVAGFYALFPFILIFLAFVKWHDRINEQKDYYGNLTKINERELGVLDHQFDQFDGGAEFEDPEHSYTSDLDMFGPNSIFQYLNRTITLTGKKTLAKWLSGPASKEEIEQRQAAVLDLSGKIDWRQDWQARGMHIEEEESDMPDLLEWLEQDFFIINHPIRRFITPLLPIIMAVAMVLAILQIIPHQIIIILWFVNIAIIKWIEPYVRKYVAQTAKKTKIISLYQQLFESFEKETFTAPKLVELQKRLGVEGKQAGDMIKQLGSMSASLNIRANLLTYLLFNTFFLWELIYCKKLEHWKQQMRGNLDDWFTIIGEVEALSSLGNLHFNQPDWCMPQIEPDYFSFDTKASGHLLLHHNERICNDMRLDKSGKLMLITGSNMAGKSTFLRTIGINLVMAMAGSPVCAKSFKSSVVTVYSSMRNKDSIQDSASSFYAELSGLKRTIDVVKAGEFPVFFLLDEILKGTNTQDRHTGSKALIQQLIKYDGVGIVSTHDLALCDMAKDFNGDIENWCFEVLIEGDKMHFDYTIKPGVCQSMNATLLMKQMGIEME